MCRQVTCRTCGKVTWAGCGQHVDQVMRGVPVADRCPGHDGGERQGKGSATGGLLGRLLGR